MITRRRAALMLGAVAFAPIAASAQQQARVWRIGYFGPPSAVAPGLLDAFRDGLRERGYIEGRNLVIEYRYTDRPEKGFAQEAADLVASKVDVIAASLTFVAIFAQKATDKIPIVIMNGDDPVENGLAVSLARPGGNVTGVVRLSSELIGKHVLLLAEVVPRIKRMAMLVNPNNPVTPFALPNAKRAAQSRGIELVVVEARSPEELDGAARTLSKQGAAALVVMADGMFYVQRARIAEIALKQRMPSIYAFSEHVSAGGLVAYSASSPENYRRAADYVDKILRGAKAGDLPIEQPTKFELIMNMKTARALDIKVPDAIRVRVDKVIE